MNKIIFWMMGVVALAMGMGAQVWAGDVRATLDSTDGSSAFVVRDADSNELARVQSDGMVGIGTATPGYKLDVAGAINGTAVTINGTPVASSTDTYWSTGGGGKIQYSGGNVGVGVADPAYALEVAGDVNLSGDLRVDGAAVSIVTNVTATSPLASSGGTAPNLTLQTAGAAQAGALSSEDWSTFSAKVPTNRTIATTAPLTGGGALSGNLTLALPEATASANGHLSSNDWALFNAKVPTNRTITASTGLTGGGTLAADRMISLTGQALALHNLNATGLVIRTGADAITSRVIAVSGNGIAVANSNGVSGNPTLSLNIGTGSVQVAAGNHIHADYATPPGVIQAYGGSAAPSGYMLCNGAAVSRTTYADLFSAIGTNYGVGDGSTTFNVPNLQGRVAVGLSAADAEFNVRGETGGAKTHALASNEVPAHVHLVDPPDSTTTTNGSHTHSYNDRYRGTTISDDASDRNVASDALNDAARTTGSGGSHAHTLDIPAFNSGSSGGGVAHNNLQPYLVVNYIIKH